jgi:hypothetical protein
VLCANFYVGPSVIRTHNLLHESPPLYQLRYAGPHDDDDFPRLKGVDTPRINEYFCDFCCEETDQAI